MVVVVVGLWHCVCYYFFILFFTSSAPPQRLPRSRRLCTPLAGSHSLARSISLFAPSRPARSRTQRSRSAGKCSPAGQRPCTPAHESTWLFPKTSQMPDRGRLSRRFRIFGHRVLEVFGEENAQRRVRKQTARGNGGIYRIVRPENSSARPTCSDHANRFGFFRHHPSGARPPAFRTLRNISS